MPPHHTAPPSAPGDAPLLLAVEATRLAVDDRGIGRYVRALLPRLLALRPALRLALHVRPRDADRVAALVDALVGSAARARVAVRPLRELTRAGADVHWYPWNVARPTPRRGVVVATVHDIAPVALAEPGWRLWRRNRRWRRLYAATAERATLLVVDSAFTGAELERVFAVPPARMRVVPLAADDAAPTPAGDDDATLARLGVRRPFVLAVGAAEGRKNLAALERAMHGVLPRVPDASLVLAGPRRPGAPAAGEPAWKRTLGFVTEGELAVLYRSAACLAVPSTYEGFGLPVLEGMRVGTPVVAARRASLPEVGGDAAAWVEPDDDAGIAEAIVRVLTDAGVRDAMRAAGLAQAARFTWDETARRTLAAFDEARGMGG